MHENAHVTEFLSGDAPHRLTLLTPIAVVMAEQELSAETLIDIRGCQHCKEIHS